MSTPSLPPLSEITASNDTSPNGPLAVTLAMLFEPSETLYTTLVPALATSIPKPRSYAALIDAATRALLSWPHAQQAAFVGAHPRIGEVSNLSALSAREQAARATPAEVLARLAVLNAEYERRYEGLRYITFVNGRSRKEVMEEMEEKLGEGEGEGGRVPMGSEAWVREVRRAVEDVGRIARARLATMGVDEGESGGAA